jgi:hypothetical protein
MPLAEMFNRSQERTPPARAPVIMPLGHAQGIDHMVEMRIRAWMLRMKDEAADTKKESGNKLAQNRNQISPRKR